MLGTYRDVLLGLREAVLVGDTFQLVALPDEASILHLDLALLLHDLGDLLAHHLRHFFAHIILQVLQEL